MNNVFAAKLLQNLRQKKANKGFTLIELLVVVIIIGILSAVALPQFLNQASRARQSEAETTLGALNRAQQTFRLESPDFGTIAELTTSGSISIDTTGDYYSYSDQGTPDGSFARMNGTALADYDADIRDYQSGVFQNSATGAFNSVLCRGDDPTKTVAADTAAPDSNGCSGDFKSVK